MDARVLCPGCVRGVQQRFHLLALFAEDHGHLFADRAIRRCHQSAVTGLAVANNTSSWFHTVFFVVDTTSSS